ncbi:ammonium transporter [Endothiovibrio diazotrophicus]
MNTIDGDVLWILGCGFLVVLMQAGFTCLESGLVRSKNSINVAIKNLADFCVSFVLFFLFGFALMFGPSNGGLIGSGWLLGAEPSAHDYAFFFFQAVFCGTATTIVSGAVAERMRFVGYLLTAILLAGVIYPIVGHWAWAHAADGSPVGWLARLGFVDFAGSTIVHSVGGWVSLAALLVIGPRLGRFGEGGRPVEGHSLPLAALGVFLLWFGWFGFNGGSTLEINDRIPLIIVNTTLAGAAGGVLALATSWLRDGLPLADRVMNGVIAGLVAVTAGCNLLTAPAALLVGAVGGVVVVYSAPLLERLGIDDAISAVPAHLAAGIWGTLAVALFAPAGSWGTMARGEFLLVQAAGVLAVGLFTFGVSLVVLSALDRVVRLRVTPRDERIGLNVAEHGATTSILDLITQMDQQARSGDFTRPVEVEPETEAHQIAAFYNVVLEKFNLETGRRHSALRKLEQLANYDTLTGLANRRFFFEMVRRALARSRRNGSGGAVLYLDLDGFKRVNDTLGHEAGDRVLKEAAVRIASSVRESDLVARLGGDEFALLMESPDISPGSAASVAEKFIEVIGDPFQVNGETAHLGVSVGIALFSGDHPVDVKVIVRQADHAMYAAKLAGKGIYRFHGDEAEPLPSMV